jgi:hypothetical protein
MKFRVKQIDENKYIPQIKIGFFNNWLGIDNIWKETWIDELLQTKYCAKPSLDDALLEIDIWKTRIHKKNKFPVYHNVKKKQRHS